MAMARMTPTLNRANPVVVTATAEQQAGWFKAQNRLAILSSNSSHGFAHLTHVALVGEQHSAEISARAIDDVVRSVRTGSPLATQ
jgi:hypothetical protein